MNDVSGECVKTSRKKTVPHYVLTDILPVPVFSYSQTLTQRGIERIDATR